ncbi:MAG TPA: outer membrane beta-barrel family protein [Bacteroidales bacterium]
MKLYPQIILLIVALSLAFSGILQAVNPENKGKLKGTVLDSETREGLEYATISVYRTGEERLITGTVTDLYGHFKFENLEPGNYYLVVAFLGMDNKKIENISVKNMEDNINVGKIILNPTAKSLSEVEIVSKRAPVEYMIDKKVITVDRQITATSGSAVDVLENTPSVKVDVEGNVTLRGSSGFTVLVDGKPTILDPSDALRQIPASTIENIEIITNPSVKYRPDGSSGIINIITKKNHLDGLSGIVNLNAGMYNAYGGDFLLSYRFNKLNVFAGASYNKRTRPGTSISNRETYSLDTTFFVNSSGDRDRQWVGTNVKAGIEYDVTKNDFISLGGTIGNWDMEGTSDLFYTEWDYPSSYNNNYSSMEKSARGGNYYELNGAYQRKFARKGHQLNLNANYQFRDADEYSQSELTDTAGVLDNGKKNVETGPGQRLDIKLDYTLPLREKDKFEAGFQSRNNRSEDNTELYFLDPETGDFILQPEFSHLTDYTENIYALYALYAGYLNNFGYQLGLRGEYTDRTIASSGEPDFVLDGWDYFPTIHLSYDLPKDMQLMASYSRRIDRPRGWELEPFITWQDEFNVRQGNPDLLPELIDSFDASFLKKFDKGSFSTDLYYKITHNKVERVQSIFVEDVILNTVENVGKDYSLGVEFLFNYNLLKWWEIDFSGTYYYYKIEGTLYDAPFERTSNNWNSRFNNTFTVRKNFIFQLNSSYNSGSVTAQGTSSGFYTLDAAIKTSFLKKTLSATLQARDLFGTALRENISRGEGFYTYNKYQPKAPVVSITLSYRFNNFRQAKKGNGGDGEMGEEGF